MNSSNEKPQPLFDLPSQILLSVILIGMALAALAGCGFSGPTAPMQAPVALRGAVRGGDKPISGAKVQLYSAGTTGVGSSAIPLLSNPVDTDNDGNFVIPASYDCPSTSSQLYLVARGGNPGLPSSGNNGAIALTTMLGACNGISASSPITVNEVTTVGSVWPLAQYMKSPTDLGSSASDSSFLSAVSNVYQLINTTQGTSPGTATPESYFVESDKLNSLANALDKCVNSSGGSAGDGSSCGSLFSMATTPNGGAPTDTMSAAMRIAQNPNNEVAGVYGLSGTSAAFQPNLTTPPPDWTLVLSHPVAAPAISLATGSYIGSQTVTITDATAGSKIYYTTDGSLPTSSSGLYSGPVSVAVTSTLQAIAVEGISQSPVTSSTLTISPATNTQTPAKLAFLQQPSNTLVGTVISPAVAVVIEDANGNAVSSATNLISVNLTGANSLGGTLKVAATKGNAIFSDLAVSTAGSYTLTASSPGLGPVASTPFAISAAPPPLSVSLPLPTVSLLPGVYGPGIAIAFATSSSGASICVTTDGTLPTATQAGACGSGSSPYAKSLTLETTTTLTAIAALPGKISKPLAVTYTIAPGTNLAKADSLLTMGVPQAGLATVGSTTSPEIKSKNNDQTFWQLVPDPWGTGNSYSGSTTITYSGSGAITTNVAMANLPSAGVNAYPFVFYGADPWGFRIYDGSVQFPSQLSQMGSLIANVKYSLVNSITPADQDIAFDEWLVPSSTFSGGSGGAAEVIICPYFRFAYPPAGTLVGTFTENLLINGVVTPVLFKEYQQGSGAGSIVLFMPDSNQIASADLQLNLLDFLNRAASLGGIPGWYLAGFEYGTEYGNGQSAKYTFTTNKIAIFQMLKAN
jgi:Chitobiase/beta-hexosaminidase C-terminal domain/Glycosyl hydrolase family 12